MSTPVADPVRPMDYSSTTTPTSYVCSGCGMAGVKLWLNSIDSFREEETLKCADCAAAQADKDITEMSDDGSQPAEDGRRTDRIDWWVPAIPAGGNNTFWEYISTPSAGRHWWQRLPLR